MQFTLTIIGYSYFSCDGLSIVGDTILRCASFYFLDGVSVSTCFFKCQFFKFDFSICTILLSILNTIICGVCQSEFKHVRFEISTCQLLHDFETCFCFFSFVSIFEVLVIVVIRNSCFQSPLTVISYCNSNIHSLTIISSTLLCCTTFDFFDGVLVNTCFVEFQFFKLNVSVLVILLSIFNYTI